MIDLIGLTWLLAHKARVAGSSLGNASMRLAPLGMPSNTRTRGYCEGGGRLAWEGMSYVKRSGLGRAGGAPGIIRRLYFPLLFFFTSFVFRAGVVGGIKTQANAALRRREAGESCEGLSRFSRAGGERGGGEETTLTFVVIVSMGYVFIFFMFVLFFWTSYSLTRTNTKLLFARRCCVVAVGRWCGLMVAVMRRIGSLFG